jgi:hypothetical protein
MRCAGRSDACNLSLLSSVCRRGRSGRTSVRLDVPQHPVLVDHPEVVHGLVHHRGRGRFGAELESRKLSLADRLTITPIGRRVRTKAACAAAVMRIAPIQRLRWPRHRPGRRGNRTQCSRGSHGQGDYQPGHRRRLDSSLHCLHRRLAPDRRPGGPADQSRFRRWSAAVVVP